VRPQLGFGTFDQCLETCDERLFELATFLICLLKFTRELCEIVVVVQRPRKVDRLERNAGDTPPFWEQKLLTKFCASANVAAKVTTLCFSDKLG
jgi:hypothetical protein